MFENFIDFLKARPLRLPTGEEPKVALISNLNITLCRTENEVMTAEQCAFVNGVPVDYFLVKFGRGAMTLINSTRSEIIQKLRDNETYPAESEEPKEESKPTTEETDDLEERMAVIKKHTSKVK